MKYLIISIILIFSCWSHAQVICTYLYPRLATPQDTIHFAYGTYGPQICGYATETKVVLDSSRSSSSDTSFYDILIYGIRGTYCYQAFGCSSILLDTANLAQGHYTIRIHTGYGIPEADTFYYMPFDTAFFIVDTNNISIERNIKSFNIRDKIEIYPNPFVARTIIYTSGAMHAISIYNIQGQRIFSVGNLNTNKYVWDPGNIKNGTYLIKCSGSDGKSWNKLFIKLK